MRPTPFDLAPIQRREHLFWRHVAQSGPDDCWPWTGVRRQTGYGFVKRQGHLIAAHRVAFALANGYVPTDMVCHHCDNPPCCNPAHLYEGSAQANSDDKVRRGRAATGRKNGAYTRPETRPRGESHGRARLTVAQVQAIRRRLRKGERPLELGKYYGVTSQTIYWIREGKTWRSVP